MRASDGSPKRSASRTAIGRAPIVKMSRRMPPTPVAAPWYGSTARRVVVGLDLEGDRQAVADRDDAGVLARPGDDALAGGRQGPQQRLRALVRAVLAPHDAEHRELEVVRVAPAEPAADGVAARRPSPRAGDGAAPRVARPRSSRAHAAGCDGDLGHRAVCRSLGALDQRAEDRAAVLRAEDRLRGAFRVGHQAGDVAGRVQHAGDGPQRPIRVGGVIGPGRAPAASTYRNSTWPSRSSASSVASSAK